MPTPASTNGTTKPAYPAFVCASCRIQAKPTAWRTRPGAASARAPTRSTRRPATGATSSGVIVHGRNRSPVPSGESPRAIWKYWLVTYAVAKIDAAIRNWVSDAAAKIREPNSDSGTIGAGATDSHAMNPASRHPPTTSATRTSGDVHPATGARSTPQTSDPMAPEAVTIPIGSSRVRGPYVSGRTRRTATAAARPSGTLTQKIQCQSRPWVTTPPTSGPDATPRPATPPQIPTTAPRRSAGKVEVSRVRPSGMTMAAPRPWTARKPMRTSRFGASPQAADASVNSNSPATYVRRRPSRSPRAAAVMMPAANVSAYALMIHGRFPAPPPRSAWIEGRAVTTTRASRVINR